VLDAHDVVEQSCEVDDSDSVEHEVAGYLTPFVAMLPLPYREALTLVELEGMTHKRAAEMLGISLSGMKSRVQRGRVQLRKALEECCDIALDGRGRVLSCSPRPDGRAPDDVSPSGHHSRRTLEPTGSCCAAGAV